MEGRGSLRLTDPEKTSGAQGLGSALYEAYATSLLRRSSRLGTYHQFLFQIQARGWDSRAVRTQGGCGRENCKPHKQR